MEKINIAELLRNCPKGMELDCTMFDNVVLEFVANVKEDTYPIKLKTKNGTLISTTEYGCYDMCADAKCVIFPKGKTTWEGFVPPCQFKDGDIVVAEDNESFQLFLLKHLTRSEDYNDHDGYCYFGWDFQFNELFEKGNWGFNRLATEEEKQYLFDTIKDNGYKWNEETKTLERLPKFKDGDIVYIKTRGYNQNEFIIIFKEIKNDHIYRYISFSHQTLYTIKNTVCHLINVEEIRFATEEEKQKLFQAIKDNGYKWNPETKTLKKLPKFKVGDTISNGKASITINYIDNEYYCEIGRDFATKLPIKNQDEWDLISEKFPNKFNINTLIPFESRVLVRNDESQYWIPAFWGCKRADGYTTTFGWCKYCIPFEGNEHLLETNKDCDEYFKTWK